MATTIRLIKEADLNSYYQEKILPFWQKGHFGDFYGVAGSRVNFVLFEHDEALIPPIKKLIIVPGRSEGYLKYQELCYDFFHAGYNVYVIDHRGQGISQRLLTHPEKGYVQAFDDYSTDLHQFISTQVQADENSENYLLAHSMGSAIAARYLQQYQQPITAAVFSSPMFAINSGIIPDFLAQLLVKTGNNLNTLLSKTPWYFIGQGDFKESPFRGNSLMQSEVRYQKFTELYRQTRELQLGGVTFHWLAQAITAREVIFKQLARLKIPITVLQAGDDSIVDNQAQNEFCRRLNHLFPASCPDGEPVIFDGARHELLFEKDQIRDQVLSRVIQWFEQFSIKD